MVSLRGVSSFQWSETEQVYPFEKADDGSTLYCKEIDFGALPNNGFKSVAHNIANFTVDKMHDMKLTGTYNLGNSDEYFRVFPDMYTYLYLERTTVGVRTSGDLTSVTGIYKLIYKK